MFDYIYSLYGIIKESSSERAKWMAGGDGKEGKLWAVHYYFG